MSRGPVDYGANMDAEPIHVRHADLTRTGDSAYRSRCPVCVDGFLMVFRVRKVLRDQPSLSNVDRCTRCAQMFIYDDEKIAGERIDRER